MTTLSSANGDYAYIGYVKSTTAGAGPTTDPNSMGNSFDVADGLRQVYESNVWILNSGTSGLTLSWAQSSENYESLHVGLIYDGFQWNLVGVPDVATFVTKYGFSFSEMVCSFV